MYRCIYVCSLCLVCSSSSRFTCLLFFFVIIYLILNCYAIGGNGGYEYFRVTVTNFKPLLRAVTKFRSSALIVFVAFTARYSITNTKEKIYNNKILLFL